MAGVAGAVGVYFTWRNLSQTRESTERTLWLTEQGQITERFTRAIDQLGATADDGKPKLEIRLGGIYALERIARDSPERDYSTVMEVLTAYVRENAKRPPPKEPPTPATTRNEVTGQKGNGHRGQEEEQGALPLSSPQGPRADIRAIVDVLRREKDLIPQEYRARHDLGWTDLERAGLERADLVYADLRGADLRGADLTVANLLGARLEGANLEGASLV